jgi:hypothetical protein
MFAVCSGFASRRGGARWQAQTSDTSRLVRDLLDRQAASRMPVLTRTIRLNEMDTDPSIFDRLLDLLKKTPDPYRSSPS